MRIALGIEYSGTNYSGWQSQLNDPGVVSVQSVLDKAISIVAAHPVVTTCAGRTDKGVHACGQVVHCDVEKERSAHAWVFGCNANLPNDIRVLWMQNVPDDFNARKSASARHYKYVIYNHKIRPCLLSDYVSWYYTPLDIDKMLLAGKAFIGEHDFSSVRGAGCQSKSPIREIKMLSIERRGDMVIVDIIANAFLYHMVRNIVGVLLEIGSGRRPVAWAANVLMARNRAKAGITAKPEGLYLAEVIYPESLNMPRTHKNLWFINQG